MPRKKTTNPLQERLKQAILDAIADGHNTAAMLGQHPSVGELVEDIARSRSREKFRVLDGALTGLRQAEMIEHRSKVWRLVKEVVA